VISHEIWQNVFGGRPDVVGQTMRLAGLTVEVVGVAPRGFGGMFASGRFPADTWMPLSMAPRLPYLDFDRRRDERSSRWLHVRGRAKAGMALEQVSAEVRAIGGQLDQEAPCVHVRQGTSRFGCLLIRPRASGLFVAPPTC
jgi:putative ABC transport system permease protein